MIVVMAYILGNHSKGDSTSKIKRYGCPKQENIMYSRRLSWPGSDGCYRSFGLFGHVPKVFLPNVLPVSVATIFRGQELELCVLKADPTATNTQLSYTRTQTEF